MKCLSCEMLSINGAACHEIGCPDAWKDYEVTCKECGCEFPPEDRYQQTCEDCINGADFDANGAEFYE